LISYYKDPVKYRESLENIITGSEYIGNYEKKYSDEPGNLEAAYRLAVEYYRKLRFKKSVQLFKKIIENPDVSKGINISVLGSKNEVNIYESSNGLYKSINSILEKVGTN
jgi:hypothetical protein